MSKHSSDKEAFADLRRRAESLIREGKRKQFDDATADLETLLYEIDVRHTELELQNEELRQTVTALEASYAEYARLYQSSPVGLITLDKKGTIQQSNPAARRLFRQSRSFPESSHFTNFIHLNDLAAWYANLRKQIDASATTPPQPIELRLSEPGKTDVHVRIEIKPDFDENGRFQNWRLAMVDITAQKEAEKALRCAYDNLEAKVLTRTAELREKNQILERFAEDLKKERDQREYLSKKLVEILEKERREIAAALHDEVGHILTQIKIDLDLLKDNINAPGAAVKSDIDVIQGKISGSMDYIHNLSRSLRPPVLDDLGLVSALKAVCEEINARQQVMCQLFTKDVPDKIDEEKALAVYRIVQEATTNCLKHAQATYLFVNLTRRAKRLLLTIEDDGAGFDYVGLTARKDGKRKLGLMIMKERAVQVGGEFQIESQAGRGTQIVTEVPL